MRPWIATVQPVSPTKTGLEKDKSRKFFKAQRMVKIFLVRSMKHRKRDNACFSDSPYCGLLNEHWMALIFSKKQLRK